MRSVGLALRALLGAIGLIFVIVFVAPLIAEMTGPSAEEETLARVEADMPRLRDYDHVALPVTAPPAGAMVLASPHRDGLQQTCGSCMRASASSPVPVTTEHLPRPVAQRAGRSSPRIVTEPG